MKRSFQVVSTALAFSLAVFPAHAQDDDSDDGQVIEEVIVTAEKRAENILEVPVTMTAFSAQSIEELGMTNNDDLEQLVPGLQFQDEGQLTGQGTSIRGIGTRLAGETHPDLAVATYVDGVYTLGNYGVAPNMFDIERIEVARGPQGTLNGRNSIAGSISYFSKRPTEEWDLLVHSELTNQFSQRHGVAFGGPLTDNIAFRINGSFYNGDGAQENIGHGDDYDAPDQTFLAPQLRFHTDRMDLNLRYTKLDDDGRPRSQVLLSRFDPSVPEYRVGAQTFNNAFYLWDGRIPSVDEDCPPLTPGWECGDLTNKLNVNRSSVGSSNADQSTVAFNFELTNNLSVRYNYGDMDNFSQVQRDRDMTNRIASANDPLTASDADVPLRDEQFEVYYTYKEESHEIQLVSNNDGPFNFIAGLFTYENYTHWGVPSFVFTNHWANNDPEAAAVAAGFPDGCAGALALLGTIFGAATSEQEAIDMGTPGNWWQCPAGTDHAQWLLFRTTASSDTKAAFFNAEYQLNDDWMVSGGLRYTEDRKTQETNGGWAKFEFGWLAAGVPFEIIFDDSDPNPRTWSRPIGHISLEYVPEEDRLVYGRISTGYRAGSFNPKSDAIPTFVKEETLVNYEVGWKGLFMDGRLRMTSGVFYNTFDNYQITGSIEPQDSRGRVTDGLFSQYSSSPVIEFTNNIDDTKIWGGEVDFIYQLNDKWRLSGFYTYMDSQIGPHLEVVRGHPNPELGEWTHIDFNTGQTVTSEYIKPTDMTGHQLPMQPSHKWALSSSYETPLSGAMEGDLQLLGTYSWVAERFSDLSNFDISTLPAYSRFDMRGTWTNPSETISATLFIQNVFDEIGVIEYLHLSTIAGNPSQGTLTRPREIGLELRWRPRF